MVTLRDAFLQKYPHRVAVITHFYNATGVTMEWENLSKLRLKQYADYLDEKFSGNTAKAYCSMLKAVLNLYSEEHTPPRGFEKVLSIKRETSQNVYLTIDEINRIIEYKPKSRFENIIRNQFVKGCLTGARHSDYIQFGRENVEGDFLQYVSIKTHTQAKIPLSPALKRILEEEEESGDKGQRCCDAYFNRIIKRICKNVGIDQELTLFNRGRFTTAPKWKFVASHTARRSFATNLYLAGVDIYTISKLCGHSSVEMTKGYICCGAKISEDAFTYFNSFE